MAWPSSTTLESPSASSNIGLLFCVLLANIGLLFCVLLAPPFRSSGSLGAIELHAPRWSLVLACKPPKQVRRDVFHSVEGAGNSVAFARLELRRLWSRSARVLRKSQLSPQASRMHAVERQTRGSIDKSCIYVESSTVTPPPRDSPSPGTGWAGSGCNGGDDNGGGGGGCGGGGGLFTVKCGGLPSTSGGGAGSGAAGDGAHTKCSDNEPQPAPGLQTQMP